MTFGPEISFRITGLDQVRAKGKRFRVVPLERVRAAAQVRARDIKARVKAAMRREYTSPGSGRLANSLGYRTQLLDDGVDIQFHIGGFRELEYVTALGGGYFTTFPVDPFVMVPSSSKFLRIQFADGIVFTKYALWGSQTGGFSRDVLTEEFESELEAFQSEMIAVVENAIVELTVE